MSKILNLEEIRDFCYKMAINNLNEKDIEDYMEIAKLSEKIMNRNRQSNCVFERQPNTCCNLQVRVK